MRPNEEIRRAIGAAGLKQYQVAAAMGMNDGNFSRKLRTELGQDEKTYILTIIANIEKAEV